MSCIVIYPCPGAPPQSMADLVRAAGHDAVPGSENVFPEPFTGPIFLKGDLEPEQHCRCGHTADFLCDKPIGRGKTCDLPLCWCCRVTIGEDYDLCPVHAAEWSGRNPPVQQALFRGPQPVAPSPSGKEPNG